MKIYGYLIFIRVAVTCYGWEGTTIVVQTMATRVLFQYLIRHLIVRSYKALKTRDLYLELSDRSKIWQAPRQPCCRCACRISKQCTNLSYRSRGFKPSRDLTIRCIIRDWNEALGPDSTSYQYKKSHCGDKTIWRPSYLHNGISCTGKMTSLYWIRALMTRRSYKSVILRLHFLMVIHVMWLRCMGGRLYFIAHI